MTRHIDIAIEPDIAAVEILVEEFDPTRFHVGDTLRWPVGGNGGDS
jgi:hypothetical protein